MAGISIFALVRRFGSAWRNDGLFAAISRAGSYVRRRVQGADITILGGTAASHITGADQYLHGIWQTLARADAFHISDSPAINRGRRQIAMIADLNLPQCRKYRVEQLAAFWRGRGVDFDYAHYQDVPRAARIMQHATHLMEYRLQTGPASDMLRYEARRLRLPILYDLDDPLFSVSAYETYRNMEALEPGMKAHFVSEAPKYLSMMNGADILSVSTPGMAAHAALYSGRPVFLRRNFADEQTLAAGSLAMRGQGPEEGIFRVGFASGSKGHEIDLAEIIDPLAEFILTDPKRRLMLIGHFDLSHLPKALMGQVETAKFMDYDGYLRTLRRVNCAVMPLCDDAFNRCKSAVRVLDAAAVAVPAIVGMVGDLPQVVRADQTGFVAADQGDWMAALRALAADPALARHMGQAARLDLEQRWRGSDQPHVIAPELIDWVEA